MQRLALCLKPAVAFALALHVQHVMHHRFHGPSLDYLGLALASLASWVGVPGPGEPVLIAEGIFASRHNLDISSVIFVAFVGASAGGIAGWLLGLKAGRALVTLPGPFRSARLKAVERGEEVFTRYPVLAILLTPSWVAGINKARTAVYLPANELAAMLWAAGIGLGAYYVGPPIVDLVSDIGLATALAVAALAAGIIGLTIFGRRRAPG